MNADTWYELFKVQSSVLVLHEHVHKKIMVISPKPWSNMTIPGHGNHLVMSNEQHKVGTQW